MGLLKNSGKGREKKREERVERRVDMIKHDISIWKCHRESH
jgi:hypothetical protein